jgi:hypothetical protein
MFWNRQLAERKSELGIRVAKDGGTYERRFICPDCIYYVLAQIAATGRTQQRSPARAS